MNIEIKCPRCNLNSTKPLINKDCSYKCECGLEFSPHTAHITLGKYSIFFVEEATYIHWEEPIIVKTANLFETDKAMERIFGTDWCNHPQILANAKAHIVYTDEQIPNRQTIRLPYPRWGISLIDIEKLMVLR